MRRLVSKPLTWDKWEAVNACDPLEVCTTAQSSNPHST